MSFDSDFGRCDIDLSEAIDIDSLSDVTITAPVADNEILAYDSTAQEWINQTAAEAGLAAVAGSDTQIQYNDGGAFGGCGTLLWDDATNDLKLQGDSDKMFFGAGDDASIYYDGTDLIINPDEVGSGKVYINSAYKLPNVDGTINQILQTDGAGNTSWVNASSGSPGGSDTQIQYNDGGAFGGISTFVWDDTDVKILSDTTKLLFGAGGDAGLNYDGTDLVLDTAIVGTGGLQINGPTGNNSVVTIGADANAAGNLIWYSALTGDRIEFRESGGLNGLLTIYTGTTSRPAIKFGDIDAGDYGVMDSSGRLRLFVSSEERIRFGTDNLALYEGNDLKLYDGDENSNIKFHADGNNGVVGIGATRVTGANQFQCIITDTQTYRNTGEKVGGLKITADNDGTADCHGILISSVASGAGTGYGIRDESGANWSMEADNQKLFLGVEQDASIYYDGTNLVIDPKEVGSGIVSLNGANLTTTGTLTAEQLTSTDDITMQGHLLTLGDNSATDIVLYFDGSANDGTITYDESADEFQISGSVDISAGTTITGAVQHMRFVLINPNVTYDTDAEFCIVPSLDAAITITNLEVTCDADPTTEVTGDLKYADAFIGLANPVVINDFDTTNGVRSDSSITSGSIASGKCIYISFDAQPEAAITQIAFDITYYYT